MGGGGVIYLLLVIDPTYDNRKTKDEKQVDYDRSNQR